MGRVMLVALCLLPAAHAESIWRALPIRCHAEYLQHAPGGEGEQHPKSITRCPAAPARVNLAIDVAGTWSSTNTGRSWFKNMDNGLYVQYLQTLAVDPLNPDILFTIAAPPSGQEANFGGCAGIYRSPDGGASWTRVLAVPVPYISRDYLRITRSLLVCRSPDAGASNAAIWYACIDGTGVFRSADAGLSWALWHAAAPKAFYAAAVRRDPVADGDVVYVGSTDGLHLYQAGTAGVTRSSVPVPKTYDPPADGGNDYEGGISSVHIDEPSQRLWVARRFDKAYRSRHLAPTNDLDWEELPLVKADGSAWLLAPSTSTNNWPATGYAKLLFVHPTDARYAHLITAYDNFYLEQRGGSDCWRQVPSSACTNSDTIAPYRKSVRADHTGLAFDPHNPTDVVAYSAATPWRSASAGRAWQQSNDGFTGYAWTYGRSAARFHPEDSNTVMLLVNDIGPVISTTAWAWFWCATNGGTPAGLWRGAMAGDFGRHWPASPQLTAQMGDYLSFRTVVSRDNGLSWQLPAGAPQLASYRYSYAVRHVDDAMIVTPVLVSTNQGQTFNHTSYAAYPGRVPPPALPTVPDYAVLDAATNRTHPLLFAADCSYGFRYVLRGEWLSNAYYWSLVYSNAPLSFYGLDGAAVFAADPHRPSCFYAAVSNGTHILHYDTNAALTGLPPASALALYDFAAHVPGAPGMAMRNAIDEIEPDPRDAGAIYVGTYAAGLPCVFHVRLAPDRTLIVTDITGTLPRMGARALRADPHRGHLYVGTHAGTFRCDEPVPEPAAGASLLLLLARYSMRLALADRP